MFKKQFSANKVNPPRLCDLFNVRQSEGELLKAYLNRFCAVSVRLQTHDEEMVVVAFEQGMLASPFSDSLIKNPTEMLSEVRQRATTHIKAKKTMLRKNSSSLLKQPRHKENSRDRSNRSNEASIGKRTNLRYVLYVSKKEEPEIRAREKTTIRPRFRVSCKELLSMPGVANKLKFPQKTNQFLGSRRDT